MSFYYIFDLLLAVLIVYLSIISYQKQYYKKIFNYLKLFILITVSAKLSPYTGVFLQKIHITQADTYTTLILISFSVNLFLLFTFYSNIMKFFNHYIRSEKFKKNLAKIVSFLEIFIVVTFSLYILMQIKLVKVYINPHIQKTYSYPKIEKFYHSFLNDEFVNMVLNSDTGTNHKEVIFKSFKNAL